MDTVRGLVQPVTTNLPDFIRDFGVSLIGDKCYKRIVLDVDLSDQDCLKLAISKALGSGIVAVSAIVKLPQLFKLINSQSSEGVSFLSYVLETAAYIITLAYNTRMGNPFSTYGEVAFIALQNIAIASLVLVYSNRAGEAGIFVAGLAVGLFTIFNNNYVDLNTLTTLQAGAGVLGIASKIPQIYTIFAEGTTGQLSAFAVFNFLFGSLSRIFTTYQEVNDPVLLYGYIAGFALNLVLALQVLYYWNAPKKSQKNVPRIQIQNEKSEPIAYSSGSEARSKKTPSTRRRA